MIAIPYYETSYFAFHNFSAHIIEYKGEIYPTVEHAFHALKFEDKTLHDRIRSCASPIAAYRLGKELKPQRRGDWDEIKVGVLEELIRCKVAQHDDVRNVLIATGAEEIVEVNPNDDFWGNGPDGNGQNHTGKVLMRIRNEVQA